MNNALYQSIDELVRENERLSIKLELANIEISKLEMKIRELEDGEIDKLTNPQDSNHEMSRMSNPIQQRCCATRRSIKYPLGRRNADFGVNDPA